MMLTILSHFQEPGLLTIYPPKRKLESRTTDPWDPGKPKLNALCVSLDTQSPTDSSSGDHPIGDGNTGMKLRWFFEGLPGVWK